MTFTADFETTVCGIPCGVVVENYQPPNPFKGPASQCWSDWDWYGYTDPPEYLIIDRKGYQADWLYKKMNENDIEQLEIEIAENYRKGESYD